MKTQPSTEAGGEVQIDNVEKIDLRMKQPELLKKSQTDRYSAQAPEDADQTGVLTSEQTLPTDPNQQTMDSSPEKVNNTVDFNESLNLNFAMEKRNQLSAAPSKTEPARSSDYGQVAVVAVKPVEKQVNQTADASVMLGGTLGGTLPAAAASAATVDEQRVSNSDMDSGHYYNNTVPVNNNSKQGQAQGIQKRSSVGALPVDNEEKCCCVLF